ncbi:hypothetical protein D3C78_337430 [compost metagenome]
MHTGGGGVAEQVEEALTGRFTLNAQAHRTVIEEQAGVQVISEVDQQFDAALLHLQELALGALALVLAGTGLALAALDHHPALVDAQGLRNRCQGVEQTRLGFLRVDRTWRGVFLHVHPILIQVDGQGVLGHVGIVQAITADVVALGPLAQLLEVLLQAVGEHLPAFAQASRLAGHGCG